MFYSELLCVSGGTVIRATVIRVLNTSILILMFSVIPIWTRVRILSEERAVLGEGQIVPGTSVDGLNFGSWRRKVLVTSEWAGTLDLVG